MVAYSENWSKDSKQLLEVVAMTRSKGQVLVEKAHSMPFRRQS
jgi:hypothetical protein